MVKVNLRAKIVIMEFKSLQAMRSINVTIKIDIVIGACSNICNYWMMRLDDKSFLNVLVFGVSN